MTRLGVPRTRTTPASGSYHHGNLRRALLDATSELIADVGPSGFSMREIARRAGVSHAAPAHHFADRTGLLTAFATEGLTMLADQLDEACAHHPDEFVEVGVAYVEFAVRHRSYFEVMFRRDLVDADDAAYQEALHSSTRPLQLGLTELRSDPSVAAADVEAVAIGLWAQMHGLAALVLGGSLGTVDDSAALVRRVSAAVDRAVVWEAEKPRVPRRATRSNR
jgi:AcrR family transcriptional regulator